MHVKFESTMKAGVFFQFQQGNNIRTRLMFTSFHSVEKVCCKFVKKTHFERSTFELIYAFEIQWPKSKQSFS